MAENILEEITKAAGRRLAVQGRGLWAVGGGHQGLLDKVVSAGAQGQGGQVCMGGAVVESHESRAKAPSQNKDA